MIIYIVSVIILFIILVRRDIYWQTICNASQDVVGQNNLALIRREATIRIQEGIIKDLKGDLKLLGYDSQDFTKREVFIKPELSTPEEAEQWLERMSGGS